MRGRPVALALALCLLAGCAPAPAPAEPPAPAVYTDWSRLTPYAPVEPLYSYSDHYCGDGPLQSWDGYGALLPYAGGYLRTEHYIVDQVARFGLVTARGELVTAPVYADITHAGGFLLLSRGSAARYQDQDPIQERGDFDLTVAAADGRWVREAPGLCLVTTADREDGLLALCDGAGGLEFWNGAGETVATFSGDDFRPYLGDDFSWVNEGGPWLYLRDGLGYVECYRYPGESGEWEYHDEALRLYLDLAAGQILETPPEGYPAEPEGGQQAESPAFPGYDSAWEQRDAVTGQVYYRCHRVGGAADDLLDESGNVVWADCEDLYLLADGMLAVWTGQWSWTGVWDDQGHPASFSWYDLTTGACVFRYPLTNNEE